MKLRLVNKGILGRSLITDAESGEILADVFRSTMMDGWVLECRGTVKRYATYNHAVNAAAKILGGELSE